MSDLSDGKGTQKVILKINWFAKNAFNIVLILSVMKTYFFSKKIIVGKYLQNVCHDVGAKQKAIL